MFLIIKPNENSPIIITQFYWPCQPNLTRHNKAKDLSGRCRRFCVTIRIRQYSVFLSSSRYSFFPILCWSLRNIDSSFLLLSFRPEGLKTQQQWQSLQSQKTNLASQLDCRKYLIMRQPKCPLSYFKRILKAANY